MLVVAILAVALAFGIPAISDAVHRAPIAQATKDIMDACRHARSQAILNGQPMELRIYPRELRVEVAQAPVDVAPGSTPPPPSSGASEPAAAPTAHYQPQSPFISSAKISEDVRFEMVDVNFIEYKDADVARVRFYPNGTCDELTLVMHSDMEYRKISLEVVTSLASVDADVNGFNAR